MKPNNLLIGFNNCLQCGSFAFRSSLLCRYCEDILFKSSVHPKLFKNEVRKIPCRSLFLWRKDRDRILNRISLGLKGARQKRAWQFYAEKFLEVWTAAEELPRDAVFVPCPSSTDKPDHAWLFADALSELTGIPIKSVLKKTSVMEQKQLSRLERESILSSKFNLCSITNEKFSRVYFVDDIITTGATVLAAQLQLNKCLKNSGHVKAISLIIRE